MTRGARRTLELVRPAVRRILPGRLRRSIRSRRTSMLVLRHPVAAFDSRHLLYYVGVHHKAGTVWMESLHQLIAWRLGLPLIRLIPPPDPGIHPTVSATGPRIVDAKSLASAMESVREMPRGVVFDWSARFAGVPMQLANIRGIHLIRDPRDMLISATFYHLVNTRETWLQAARPEFGGMSYQQKLRSLSTVREALMFELRHVTRVTIKEMATFPKLPNVSTITYESLMDGDVLAAFEAMFSSLGLSGRARRVALECARQQSIVLNPDLRRSHHIRSGQPQQWRQQFDQDLGKQFVAEAGDELAVLGYEPDDSWLNELPAARSALDEPLPVQEPEDGLDGGLETRTSLPRERASSPDAGTEAVSR